MDFVSLMRADARERGKLRPDLLAALQYAAIVNLYGPRLREIAPESSIVACGQKRSNDMNWSEKLIEGGREPWR